MLTLKEERKGALSALLEEDANIKLSFLNVQDSTSSGRSQK